MDSDRRFIPLVDIQEPTGAARICATPCPFLGAKADRITAHAFPHSDNRCFKHSIGITRDLQFQSMYCLSDDYADCSIYQNKELPPAAEPETVETKQKFQIPTVAILFVIVAIASVALIYTSIYAWNNPKDSSTNVPLVTNAILPTDSKGNPQADTVSAPLVDQNDIGAVDAESGANDSASAAQEQLSESSGKGSFRAITYEQFN